jgi:hypothetical protein
VVKVDADFFFFGVKNRSDQCAIAVSTSTNSHRISECFAKFYRGAGFNRMKQISDRIFYVTDKYELFLGS